MKIAIFGGAFNPVHREHVNIARAAVENLKLDKLIIMPTASSPHKSGRLEVGFLQRFNLCRAAFSSVPNTEISDFEYRQGGVSYSYLTCAHFASLYPTADKYFIMGADMLSSFPTWRNPRDIVSTFKIAACARRDEADFSAAKENVEKLFDTQVIPVGYEGSAVSSTSVRTLAALGADFSHLVTKPVYDYMTENKLYYMEMLSPLRSLLTVERWVHTQGVAKMCAANRDKADLSEERAIIMAALHDCGKYVKEGDKLLSGFVPPKDVPAPVMHQFTGAYIAEHYFGVKDEVLLDAIRYHTTGKANMTKAGILLYLCDMLEEGRNFEGVDELRALFYQDMNACFKEALYRQLHYLANDGMPVDWRTASAYEFLRRK